MTPRFTPQSNMEEGAKGDKNLTIRGIVFSEEEAKTCNPAALSNRCPAHVVLNRFTGEILGLGG